MRELARDVRGYLQETRSGSAGVLQLAPLFLAYGLGLIFCPPAARSGVDLVSGPLLGALGPARYGALVVSAAALGVAAAAYRLRWAASRQVALAGPVALEGVLYALAMAGGLAWLRRELPGLQVLGAASAPGWVSGGVTAAGAGLHEEILFRALLLPGLVWAITRGDRCGARSARALAAVVSSLVFAGAHHLGGEPFTGFAFGFRAVAGGLLAALFLTRGLGVAAWTHTAYDFDALL